MRIILYIIIRYVYVVSAAVFLYEIVVNLIARGNQDEPACGCVWVCRAPRRYRLRLWNLIVSPCCALCTRELGRTDFSSRSRGRNANLDQLVIIRPASKRHFITAAGGPSRNASSGYDIFVRCNTTSIYNSNIAHVQYKVVKQQP